MGLLEPLTHSEEINDLLDDAKKKYNDTLDNFETQKKRTTISLEKLGKVKINSWATDMNEYIIVLGNFQNVNMKDHPISSVLLPIPADDPHKMMENIKNASSIASEVEAAGIAAVGATAVIGIASYGGAVMFMSATSGTAVAAISGAAEGNATLAWLGKGTAKAGMELAASKIILAGIIATPFLVVGALITSAYGKKKLAEAKEVHEQAMVAVAKLKVMISGLIGIRKISDNYRKFIIKFSNIFTPFINELKRIKGEYSTGANGRIDFNSLTITEQKTIQMSWLLAQIYYNVLSQSILTEQGEISPKAKDMLKSSKNSMNKCRHDTYRMKGDESVIGNLYWHKSANSMLIINTIVAIIMIIIGIMLLNIKLMTSFIFFIGAIICLPIFFAGKLLSDSQAYSSRLVRLVISLLFVTIMFVIFR